MHGHGAEFPADRAETGFSRPNLRTFLPNMLITWFVPLAAYELISPHLHSDLLALTIGAAIPAVVTLGTYLFRRRVNVIGLISVVGFAIGLAVSVFTGGNELAIKLHEPALTGLAGLILLGSAAIGRPLFLPAQRLRGAARRCHHHSRHHVADQHTPRVVPPDRATESRDRDRRDVPLRSPFRCCFRPGEVTRRTLLISRKSAGCHPCRVASALFC